MLLTMSKAPPQDFGGRGEVKVQPLNLLEHYLRKRCALCYELYFLMY